MVDNRLDNKPPSEYSELKFIIVTYRLEDNPSFRPLEEVLLKLIFRSAGFNYEKRIFGKEKVALFYGKLPCLYINGLVIQNSRLLTYIKEILEPSQITPYINKLNLAEFILTDELKNLIELSYFIQRYEKIRNSKKTLHNLIPIIKKNVFYEKILSNYLNVPVSTKCDQITQKIIKNYSRLSSILNMEDLTDHVSDKFNILEAFFYSYLKEEKTLFMTITRPTLENIRNDEKDLQESFYKFFGSYDQKKKNLKVKVLSTSDILKIGTKLAMPFQKPGKKEKPKIELNQFEREQVLKYNLVSIGVFLGMATLMFIYGLRR